jgi:hypothetical protein
MFNKCLEGCCLDEIFSICFTVIAEKVELKALDVIVYKARGVIRGDWREFSMGKFVKRKINRVKGAGRDCIVRGGIASRVI